MLVMFECGCIGVPVNAEKYLCLKACDWGSPLVCFDLRERGRRQRMFTELTEAQIASLVSQFNKHLTD